MLLSKVDVFCTKKYSHDLPWAIKNILDKDISEIFDCIFFFPGLLASLLCSARK